MKQKIFTLLIAFLTMVGNAVWGQAIEINIENLSRGSSGDGWKYSGTYKRLKLDGGNGRIYTLKGTGVETELRVRIDGDCTVNLKNVNIKRSSQYNSEVGELDAAEGGRAISLDEGTSVTMNLIGTNHVRAYQGGIRNQRTAIYVPDGAVLTISEESTGTLYADGVVGIGTRSNESAGTINIKGGTVIAKGTPALGGTEGGNSITVTDQAVVVAIGGTSGVSPERNGGILYSNTDKTTYPNGPKVYGNVVLKSSSIWDPEVLKYLEDNGVDIDSEHLDFEDNAHLILGKGVKLPKTVIDREDEGKIYAYDITFSPNYQAGDVPTGGSSEARNTEYYYGPETTIENITKMTCANDQHENIGWADSEGNITTEQRDGENFTYTTPAVKGGGDLKTKVNTALTGVWVNTTREITIVKSAEFQETELFLSPTNAKVTFELASDSEWPSGLSYDSENRTLTKNTEGWDDMEVTDVNSPKVVQVSIKDNESDKVIHTLTVKFHIKEDNLVLTSASAKTNANLTYDGSDLGVSAFNVTTQSGIPAIYGVFYKIKSMKFKAYGSEEDAQEVKDEKVIKDAGTYSEIKLEAVEGFATIADEKTELTVSGEVTVNPYTLYIVPESNQSALQSESEQLSAIEFDLQPSYVNGEKGKTTGSLALADSEGSTISDLKKAGTFKIVRGTLALDDNEAEDANGYEKSNYQLQMANGNYTFLIKENIGTEGAFTVTVKDAFDYDGKTHNSDPDLVKVVRQSDNKELVSGTDYTVLASKDDESSATIQNAGEYTLTISGIGTYGGTLVVDDKLTINKKSVTISAGELTTTLGKTPTLTLADNPDLLAWEEGGIYEKPAFSAGELKLAERVDLQVVATYSEAFEQQTELKAQDNTSTGFVVENYTITYNFPSGTLNVSRDEDIDITDEEEETGDGENDWKWDAEANAYALTYDGNEHPIKAIVKHSDEGEDIHVEVTNVTYTPTLDEGLKGAKHAGKYTATIEVEENQSGVKEMTLPLLIRQRDLTVNLNLPTKKEEISSWSASSITVEGNVSGEIPSFGDCYLDVNEGNKVVLVDFELQDNGTFLVKNYDPTYMNNGVDITDEIENGDTGEETGGIILPDDIFPDSGDQGGDDGDDDNQGGNGDDNWYPSEPEYYHIYMDTLNTCEGVKFEFSKNVVREGNQVSIYPTVEEGYDGTDMKIYIKRTKYGYLEEVSEGVQPGEYIVYNIYTDIYVLAKYVEKEEDVTTGIEDLNSIRVYAQDGVLYVETPQQENVLVISMTGAVVKNEKQIGQVCYEGINPGIYIVRVGEKVVKVRI